MAKKANIAIDKKFMSKKKNLLSRIRPAISFDETGTPNFVIEIDKRLELDNDEIEARINQLDDIKNKLIDAADAINQIRSDSKKKKSDLELLKLTFEEVKKDKETIDKLLDVNKQSFARILESTNKETEKRSIWTGLLIGFVTGTLSSLLVWWLTTK